jgi:hypothetical protein
VFKSSFCVYAFGCPTVFLFVSLEVEELESFVSASEKGGSPFVFIIQVDLRL